MFVKKTRGGSKKNPIIYSQLVQSKRDKNGIPRHKVILNLGREDEIHNNPSFIENIIRALSTYSSSLIVVDKEDEFLSTIYTYGPLPIIDKIWNDVLSMPSIVHEEIVKKGRRRVRFDIEKSLKLMVINRLISPMSKLKIEEWKKRLWDPDGIYKKIELQHLYRTLSILSSFKEQLEKRLYEKTLQVFYPQYLLNLDVPENKEKPEHKREKEDEPKNQKRKDKESQENRHKKQGKIEDENGNKTEKLNSSELEIVFYDLTTAYFESTKEDELKRFGYSKDNKTDCVQIVIALIITPSGIPIGYDIFPGNTYEGHTIHKMVEKLKEKFNIKKVIIVGDKGILSNKVLSEIENYGYEYIVSAKLKALPKRYHEEMLDINNYHQVYPQGIGKETDKTIDKDRELILSHEIEIDSSRRLILGYSEKRRRRDEKQRNKILEKIKETLDKYPNETFTKSTYKKYLDIKTTSGTKLDEEKIEKQKMWDGFFGFYTNNKDLKDKEVVSIYRLLWKIEERFRILKSNLHLRPIYHWKKERIEGHIFVCFLALYIFSFIENMVKNLKDKSKIKDEIINEILEEKKDIIEENEKDEDYESLGIASWIIEKLDEIKIVKIKGINNIAYSRIAMDKIHRNIFKLFSVKIPPSIMKEERIIKENKKRIGR